MSDEQHLCEHAIEIADCSWCSCDGEIDPERCGAPLADKHTCTLWKGHDRLLHPRAKDDSDRYDHAAPESGAYWNVAS